LRKKSKIQKLQSGRFLIEEGYEREVTEDELKSISVSLANDIVRLQSELDDAKARLQEIKKLLGEK